MGSLRHSTTFDRANIPLIASLDEIHARISSSQRSMFELIAEAERGQVWRDSGARDMTHWLSIRYGISRWKADRWIRAARALECLPRLSEAFRSGKLGIDKVVELSRFATPQTESDFIAWASGVSVACIRRKADIAVRRSIEDVREADRARFVSWWYVDEGRRLGLEAELPAAEGAAVSRPSNGWRTRFPSCQEKTTPATCTLAGPTLSLPWPLHPSLPIPILTEPRSSSTHRSRLSCPLTPAARSRVAGWSMPRPPGACSARAGSRR